VRVTFRRAEYRGFWMSVFFLVRLREFLRHAFEHHYWVARGPRREPFCNLCGGRVDSRRLYKRMYRKESVVKKTIVESLFVLLFLALLPLMLLVHLFTKEGK
jgi:hypothetical protein